MSETPVLFLDDEEHLRLTVAQTLDLADIPASCEADPAHALEQIDRAFPGILVTDIRMPGMSGTDVMAAALKKDPDLPVILVTGHADVDLAVRSMRAGAYDFIEKPFSPERLVEVINRAREKRRLTLENRALRQSVENGTVPAVPITGISAFADRLRQQVAAIGATGADVLITGATGTGKEVVARAIHAASDRANRPFITISCAALPRDLVEIELFGHEAGAFPAATRARFGKFEHARGGTVLLDRIEALPVDVQAKLLDAVEHRTIMRLGSNEPVPLDIRFIATADASLEERLADGSFRSDLYYRLGVATIELVPLVERREDIPALYRTFRARAAHDHGLPETEPDAETLAALALRDWPGNIRELKRQADRDALGFGDPVSATPTGDPSTARTDRTLAERINAEEKRIIESVLAAHGGRINATYEALGLSRKALYEKMRKHGIDRTRFLNRPDKGT